VQAFAARVDTPALQQLRVRREDKARSSPSTGAARRTRARRWSRWRDRARRDRGRLEPTGRKVLEIRPPVPIDKGRGVRWILAEESRRRALRGDDLTDIDAFAACVRSSRRRRLYRRALRGDAAELEAQADAMVDGTRGVSELLEALLR